MPSCYTDQAAFHANELRSEPGEYDPKPCAVCGEMTDFDKLDVVTVSFDGVSNDELWCFGCCENESGEGCHR